MRLHMFYNIIHGLVDIKAESYVTVQPHGTRGAHLKYQQPHSKLLVYENSFFPASVALWNGLSPDISEAASAEVFRARLGAVNLTR